MFRQMPTLSREKFKIFDKFKKAIINNDENKFFDLLLKYKDDADILNHQVAITEKKQLHYGPTLLIEAVRLKRFRIVSALLELSHVKINLRDSQLKLNLDEQDQNALLAAIFAHDEKSAELLLTKPQCDVNACTGSGKTVLIAAVLYLPAILPRLLERKLLLLNDKDNQGKSALYYACLRRNRYVNVVPEYLDKLICNSDVDLDAADNDGVTPLMLLAARGDTLIAEALMKAGANLGCVNKQGKNAEQIAREAGHHHLAELLKPSCLQLTESGRRACTY